MPTVSGPAAVVDHELPGRIAALRGALAAYGSVLVAFSGGADSAFLLASAVEVLGADRVVAATGRSAALPAGELAAARALADALGVTHLTPATDELSRAGYQANAGDRCYFCKAELLDVLAALAGPRGLAVVATGTNADDAAAGFRPGIKAATERGAVTPLLDAGLTKSQVRAASAAMGLATWDKPAAACLSSRVAFGIPITADRLARVGRAEVAVRSVLAAAGLVTHQLRVRDLGTLARVEVDAVLVPTLSGSPDLLGPVLREAGFPGYQLDPRGFRSGSMNELLAEPDRYR